jgi:hypothetical protein
VLLQAAPYAETREPTLRSSYGSLGLLIASCLLAAASLTSIPAKAESIYDSNIEQKLDLEDAQKPKVAAIVKQTQQQMSEVFQKYGIDPNVKPDLDRLTNASDELKAINDRERKQLKQILSKSQLKRYDHIIAETGARVQKAAKAK